ncbi:uncharacterized protein RCO7_07243 [Rhynchosporium graminicola]|uniref:Uncharacterized protein n=1 Tax=Rhynchosporium graminicola TaxID=2792576 RepID=A0A1E1L873_9HELO|nr:uncharacterized protein RCO7_07243 [Rhynchosporium commune]
MDEASKIVEELQKKLSELDLKVDKFQQDMEAEFEKYTAQLLRNVPKEVSETVSLTMAEAVKSCKALYTTKDGMVKSTGVADITSILENSVANDTVAQIQTLTIPDALRRPVQDTEGSPRSPHEREKEFQGVFTPSYLPLLDSTSRNECTSSHDHSISSSPPSFKGKEREDTPAQVDASTDTRSLMNTPEANRPPTPLRKNTDEWSIGSDHSDGIRRRSALRRSSTASNKERGSPRRVRFEVEGVEVLTTSSPQQESAMSGDGPTSLLSDEDDDEAGSEMIEDVEKPIPKRISSSQALRNLSRAPLVEDGTQWTEVSAPPDGSASVATTIGFREYSSSEDLTESSAKPRSILGGALNGTGTQSQTSSDATDSKPSAKQAVDDLSDDDEDMLDMLPLKRHSSSQSASILSPANPPSIEGNKSPTSATRPRKALQGMGGLGWGGNLNFEDHKFSKSDDDGLFDFDENIESDNPRTGTQSPPEDLEDEERDSFDTEKSHTQGSSQRGTSLSNYATSPARPIFRPQPPVVGSVGSYKGHPFSMPIVNPDVHAEAAAMGTTDSFFVGSVSDGLDESNAQSFRAGISAGSHSGTPRSMSERFLRDEVLAEEKKRLRRG